MRLPFSPLTTFVSFFFSFSLPDLIFLHVCYLTAVHSPRLHTRYYSYFNFTTCSYSIEILILHLFPYVTPPEHNSHKLHASNRMAASIPIKRSFDSAYRIIFGKIIKLTACSAVLCGKRGKRKLYVKY